MLNLTLKTVFFLVSVGVGAQRNWLRLQKAIFKKPKRLVVLRILKRSYSSEIKAKIMFASKRQPLRFLAVTKTRNITVLMDSARQRRKFNEPKFFTRICERLKKIQRGSEGKSECMLLHLIYQWHVISTQPRNDK